LFDELNAYFPADMKQPETNLVDLIKVKTDDEDMGVIPDTSESHHSQSVSSPTSNV
jgi:hypothetical protein